MTARATDKHVLIIDDDPQVAAAFADALHIRGYAAAVAHSGHEGLGAVRAERPDVVLLDVTMPDANGLDVLVEIGQVDPTIPVIMVTAVVDDGVCREALRRGAYSWLSKPIELSVLERLVELAVGRHYTPIG